LPSVMKGIQHKAEVWLSRESKQAPLSGPRAF